MNSLHLGHWRMEILKSTHMHGGIDMQSTCCIAKPKGCFIRSGGAAGAAGIRTVGIVIRWAASLRGKGPP